MTKVLILKSTEKDLRQLPFYILEKLYSWIEQVEIYGIHEIRKIPGYHDEPLKGDRKGQRSVRLNKSYRLIYKEKDSEVRIEILIYEVNKHDY